MNTVRLSTLSLTIAIAVMTLGYANPSFANKPGDDGGHSHGGVAVYSVTIDGDMAGASADRWRGDFGGKKTIGLNDASGDGHPGIGEFTDLSFFTSLTGPFRDIEDPNDGIPNGAKCFRFLLVTDVLLIHEGSVSQGRGGRAEARFFFDGFTFEKVNGMDVPVLYGLLLTGQFSNSTETWPPPEGSSSTLMMTGWKLGATNEGKAIKSISCIGEGDGSDGFKVTIEVTSD